jgi:hypothetical protein
MSGAVDVLVESQGCGTTLTTVRHSGAWKVPITDLLTFLERHQPCRERLGEGEYFTWRLRESL